MKVTNTKSTGEDEIPTNLLKYTADLISGPLSHIINLSLKNGTFPNKLKCAKIKPIHKKGDVCDIGNYRPIAILTNISKIFEKIIYNRFENYLEHYGIINNAQNGFRKGKTIYMVFRISEHFI